jgi:hypothetical protein
MLTNASVWAHPTLHRDSTMEEVMAVKRRAPPRLFRNRRQTNERSPSQRPVETQWRRRQPLQSGRPSAFLPALDLELPRTSPAFQHESFWSGKHEMRGNGQAMHPQTDDRATRPCFLSESAQWANLPDHTDERGQVSAIGAVSGTQTPMGSSSEGSFVPSPQQIVQAMARSRIANASTPTTPKMNPWRKAMWDTGTTRERQQMLDSSSSDASASFGRTQVNRTSADQEVNLRQWNNTAMPLHYIIAPEIRPLQVPSPGPKPLPSPSVFEQWNPESK